MYTIAETTIKDCLIIQPTILDDNRGSFIKLYHEESFKRLGLNANYEEEYCSKSVQGVLRGMHFQTPPYAHIKLVTCISGAILDVVVDLRKNSKTYKQAFGIELTGESGKMLYVPEGLAHGFYVISKEAIFLSLNSKKYSKEHDSGIHWNSFGFNWPDSSPNISDKDHQMIYLNEFESPF